MNPLKCPPKPLKITSKGSSGYRDVSEKHDLYLTGLLPKKSQARGYRTCPVPITSYFEEVNSASANGPRQ
jgi:hypothetical protein